MAKKIMIAGYGSTGAYLLDFLARTPGIDNYEIFVISRSEEDSVKRINTTRISAGIMGFYPKISFLRADLNNVDQTAVLLEQIKPDIIAYTGRFIKGLKYGSFSYPNNIGYGAWLPLAIPLILKLMKAVKLSGITTKVINSSFPDGVCPALKDIDLPPYAGAGNLNHLIPRIKLGLSARFNLKTDQVEVMMIGSHFLNTYVAKEASAKGSPYYMECRVNGVKLDSLTDEEIFGFAKIKMTSDSTRNLMIASDIAKIIQSTIFDEGFFMHLPGPYGLIGGYPARIFADRIELVLPENIDLKAAEAINAASLKFDGIEKIAGGIYFTDELINKMKEVFGIDYPKSIRAEECELLAAELQIAIERNKNEILL
jgi:hypothetical protein